MHARARTFGPRRSALQTEFFTGNNLPVRRPHGHFHSIFQQIKMSLMNRADSIKTFDF